MTLTRLDILQRVDELHHEIDPVVRSKMTGNIWHDALLAIKDRREADEDPALLAEAALRTEEINIPSPPPAA